VNATRVATTILAALVLAGGCVAADPGASPTGLPDPSAGASAAPSAAPTATPSPAATQSPAPPPTVAPPTPQPTPTAKPTSTAKPTAAKPTATPAPLPSCFFGNRMTAPRGYDDWAVTLVDKVYRLPARYAPPNLVSTRRAGIGGGWKVRALVIPDLRALKRAATKAGVSVYVMTAYRSYATQAAWYRSSTRSLGLRRGSLLTARAGHSEHQLGTTIDFGGGWRWLARNAWRYGFVMSYPKGKSPSVTCMQFEPWHYRYVGRDLAAAIHASHLTSREYLWNLAAALLAG